MAEFRTFSTGASRDGDEDKYDFEGFISPAVVVRFGQYMHKHRDTPQGRRDSDNWQRGIPIRVYMKSLIRHTIAVWCRYRGTRPPPSNMTSDMEEDLCAILFNAQGMLHELLIAQKQDADLDIAARVDQEMRELEEHLKDRREADANPKEKEDDVLPY